MTTVPRPPVLSSYSRDAGLSATRALHFGGQSNSTGQGVSPPSVSDPDSIKFWHWEFSQTNSVALEPLAPVDGTHGLELALAPTVRAAGFTTAVHKHSRDAARINLWLSGGSVWTELLAQQPTVQAALVAANGGPVRWSVIWIQGEADTNADDAPLYAGKLRTVIGQFRGLLGAGTLFYIVQLNSGFPLDATWLAVMRTAQADVARDPGNRLIPTDGISTGGSLHYTSAGFAALSAKAAPIILGDL